MTTRRSLRGRPETTDQIHYPRDGFSPNSSRDRMTHGVHTRSHFECSQDRILFQEESITFNNSESSTGLYPSLEKSDLGMTEDEDSLSPLNRSQTPRLRPAPSPPRPKSQMKERVPQQSTNWSFLIGFAVLLAVLVAWFWLNREPANGRSVQKEKQCLDAFIKLKDKHQEQEAEVIKSIFSASEKMLRGKDSLVNSIVLLYSSISSKSFVEDALTSSVVCTPTGKSTPIVLRKENFTAAMEVDPGYVLTTFGDQLKKESIMLVSDVDLLPGSVAQAFHAICDSESPWARPATVYFTIEIPQGTTVTPENLDHLAIKILEQQWGNLPSNVLDPLITRITNQVLYIR